jgi:hypothetical protein
MKHRRNLTPSISPALFTEAVNDEKQKTAPMKEPPLCARQGNFWDHALSIRRPHRPVDPEMRTERPAVGHHQTRPQSDWRDKSPAVIELQFLWKIRNQMIKDHYHHKTQSQVMKAEQFGEVRKKPPGAYGGGR